jgi:hypothetical protein
MAGGPAAAGATAGREFKFDRADITERRRENAHLLGSRGLRRALGLADRPPPRRRPPRAVRLRDGVGQLPDLEICEDVRLDAP